jgi:hypothetical protein
MQAKKEGTDLVSQKAATGVACSSVMCPLHFARIMFLSIRQSSTMYVYDPSNDDELRLSGEKKMRRGFKGTPCCARSAVPDAPMYA